MCEVGCIITITATIISAVLSAFATCWLTDRSRRKTAKYVAKAIMKSMREEIKDGISILGKYIQSQKAVGFMPTKCWEAYPLTMDLIEIILRETKGKTPKNNMGFSPEDFLMHLKNYYAYICGTVNQCINAQTVLSPSSSVNLLQPAQKVLDMVDLIITSL